MNAKKRYQKFFITNFSHLKVPIKKKEKQKVCERQIKRKEHGGKNEA